jgi:acetyl esterase/lipase
LIDRRTLVLGTAAGAALSACGATDDDARTPTAAPATTRTPMTAERLTYGADPNQYATLHRPEGRSRGVVVVVHGGFWKAMYDASLGEPLAQDLASRGWTAWNLEYRRVGNGGGLPTTFDDVSAGIDRLADVADLDLSTVLTLGHSAGGHLATWAAARGRYASWRPERVPVTAVISQAGVLDLTTAAEVGLGGGAVQSFLGVPPGPAYDEVDPIRQVPLDVPVWCVHGSDDDVVPLSQSADYVAAAVAAGADAELVEVDGDHFTVIDPASQAWTKIVGILDAL